jgi:GNAT superfamily N-acetyltransferase
MEVIVRDGLPEDLNAVYSLVHELAIFEKAPEEHTTTVENMYEDAFGNSPAFNFLVAEKDGKIIGIAVYFIKYSTWKGRGLYLDDLIVTEKFRGMGVGKKLFDAVIKKAKEKNAKQVHWQVLDWNTPAIEFYNKLGVSTDAEWLDCKMTEDQIQEYKFTF